MQARSLLALLAAAMIAGCHRGEAEAGCFREEATPPARAATLADPELGASARDLAAALFDRDLAKAATLLTRDPALSRTRIGAHHDMLTVALASCDPRAVTLLIERGAPADGQDGTGVPLGLALLATGPELAQALLAGGASPVPAHNPLGPFRTAITAGSAGGVRMLLDAHGDPNVADRLGHTPLLIALDTERFRIAELLIGRGADPWAIDSTGGNLGTALHTPRVTADAEEAQAQQRLRARLPRLGWPTPPPTPQAIRALAVEGAWPPQGVQARPLSPALRGLIAERR